MPTRRAAARTALAALSLATFSGLLPAGAAETTTSLTLTNTGSLSISAPSSVTGTAEVASGTANAVMSVSGITVSDARSIKGQFTATMASTAMTNGGDSIAASSITWATTSVTNGIGVPSLLTGPGGTLETPRVILNGPGFGLGQSSYIVNGDLTIAIGDKPAGSYAGTLSTSIS